MINVLVADDELPAIEELAFLLGSDERIGTIPVSYTHLTLPTILLV